MRHDETETERTARAILVLRDESQRSVSASRRATEAAERVQLVITAVAKRFGIKPLPAPN